MKKIFVIGLILLLILGTAHALPETTFEYKQLFETTDTNLILTCINDLNCQSINYNINNSGWNTIINEITSGSVSDATQRGTGSPYNTWNDQQTYELEDSVLQQYNTLTTIDMYTGDTGVFELRLKYNYSDESSNYSNTLSTSIHIDGAYAWVDKTITTFSDSEKILESITIQTKTSAQSKLYRNLDIDYNYQLKTLSNTLNPYAFIFSEAGDNNIQFYSVNTNNNVEDTNSVLFNIYNWGQFTFYDESSETLLNDVTYTISPSINGDSGATLTDTNTLDLNLTGITSQEYTFTFSKTGYGTRYYTTDLNQFSDIDINFALLPSSLGSNIEFKFFAPDRTTILTSAEVLVTHNTKNYIINKATTDSEGKQTLFLNLNDSNYNFNINYAGTIYDYNAISLTINQPKDEANSTTITDNWGYILSGLAASSDLNISDSTTTLALYANTLNTYIVTISSTSTTPTYEDRVYEYSFKGNENETLQPYLLQTTDASTIKIITQEIDQLVETRYLGVEVRIYKQLTDTGRSLIEQVVTDAKGEAFVTLKAGDTYEFEIYVDGVIQSFKGNTINFIKIAGSTIVFTISTDTITDSDVTQYGFSVNWTPSSQAIQSANSGTQEFSQLVNNLGGASVTIESFIIQNNVVLASDTFTGTSNHLFSYSIDWNDLNTGTLTSTISITTDLNSYDYNYTYYISGFAGGYFDPIQGLKTGVRTDVGCSETGVCQPLLFLAIIISIGLAGFGFLGVGLGTQSTSLLFIAPMVFFTYLTWVPLELTIGIVVVGFAFMLLDRRGS